MGNGIPLKHRDTTKTAEQNSQNGDTTHHALHTDLEMPTIREEITARLQL